MKALLIVPLLFIAMPAFAAGETYSRTPAGATFSQQPVTLDLTVSAGNTPYNCEFNGGSYWYFQITDSNSVTYNSSLFLIPGIGNTNDSYTFSSLPVGSYTSVQFICTNSGGSHVYTTHNFSDSFSLTTPGNTGSSTAWMPQATQLLAGVVAATQMTGTSIWGMLPFLGVPIAFIIAFWVIEFIRAMNKRKRGSKKYRVGTSDEYDPAFQAAFVEAVDISNKAHPDL